MKCVLKVLALMAIPGMAAAGNCLPVVGTVKLEPETVPACTIEVKVPGYFYAKAALGLGNQCFKTTLKLLGFGTSIGYSGVTFESLTSFSSGAALTPAFAPSGQQILTARSWLPINYTNGTVIRTAEIIVASDPTLKRVTEQSVIISATGGLFQDVTGGFVRLCSC